MPLLIEKHLDLMKYVPFIFLLLVLIMLLVGWLYGSYRSRKAESIDLPEGLITAILGLSALVLALTFSTAVHHFDHRKNLNRLEADAVKKVFQSSQYLNPDDQAIVQKTLKEIVAIRLVMYKDVKTLDQITASFDSLNNQLTKLDVAVTVAIDQMVVEKRESAGQRLRSQLKNLTDTFEDGIYSAQDHPPAIIEGFLCVLLSISALLSGYSMAVKKQKDWFLTVIYLFLTGCTICVIFALEYPNLMLSYNYFNSDLINVSNKLR